MFIYVVPTMFSHANNDFLGQVFDSQPGRTTYSSRKTFVTRETQNVSSPTKTHPIYEFSSKLGIFEFDNTQLMADVALEMPILQQYQQNN